MKNKNSRKFDFDAIFGDKHPKDMEELRSELKLFFKQYLNYLNDLEMVDHLGYEKNEREDHLRDNHRNDYYKKNVRTSLGEVTIDVPRDRNGEFKPKLVPKYKYDISDLENNILALYSKGLSTRDISETIAEMYDVDVDPSFISRITEKLLPKIMEWQNRSLDAVYPMVFIDGIRFNVKNDGQQVQKTVYIVIGYNLEGIKDVLGFWIGESESSKYWMSVLNDLKTRGVEQIYIASCDNLKGISEAIKAVYPKTHIQKCIVHQIRNSTKFVNYKRFKRITTDMKSIYKAVNIEQTSYNLDIFEKKWKNKYYYAVKSWRENLDELTTFFSYPPEIRKLIYTTNVIENLNRNIRKITKNKGTFPSDDALAKIVFLAIEQQSKRWNKVTRNWGEILNELLIIFN